MISIKIEAELSVSLLAGPRQANLKIICKSNYKQEKGKKKQWRDQPYQILKTLQGFNN